jgi:hypothetical protein
MYIIKLTTSKVFSNSIIKCTRPELETYEYQEGGNATGKSNNQPTTNTGHYASKRMLTQFPTFLFESVKSRWITHSPVFTRKETMDFLRR